MDEHGPGRRADQRQRPVGDSVIDGESWRILVELDLAGYRASASGFRLPVSGPWGRGGARVASSGWRLARAGPRPRTAARRSWAPEWRAGFPMTSRTRSSLNRDRQVDSSNLNVHHHVAVSTVT